MQQTIMSHSLQDTKHIATSLTKHLVKNTYILLSGDLGVGKTTFTKQLIQACGVNQFVTSPTFTILNQYETPDHVLINHMDAYRLNQQSDLEMFEEQFIDAINIIEWWENINLDLSAHKWIKIKISIIDSTTRKFMLESN